MTNTTFLIIEADPSPNPENQEALKNYLAKAPIITKQYGGVAVAKYNVETALDAGMKPAIFVVMSFPDKASISGLFKDPAYKNLIPSRDQGFSSIRYFICNEQNSVN